MGPTGRTDLLAEGHQLNKAELLILNTAKKISDIAFQCGFSDVYSFSHCFKRNFGVSPKAYREMQAAYIDKQIEFLY